MGLDKLHNILYNNPMEDANMAIKLRKKAPFWCRYPIEPGSAKLCCAVLTENNIFNICDSCLDKKKSIEEKFFEKHIPPAIPREVEQPYRVRARVWP